MKHIRKIELDIDREYFEKIPAVQYDNNSRYLEITLMSGLGPIDITGHTVIVSGVKPDGTELFNDCRVIDSRKGVVEVHLSEQVSAVDGVVDCNIQLFGPNSSLLSTQQFHVYVAKGFSTKNVVSSNEYKGLVEALSAVQGIDNRFTEVNSQLEEKANLNSVFGMANMGQDVKEAMTGGSVAVVGKDAILTENIVDDQVTIKKLDPKIYSTFGNMYVVDMYTKFNNGWIGFKLSLNETLNVGDILSVKNMVLYSELTDKINIGVYSGGTFISELKLIEKYNGFFDLDISLSLSKSSGKYILFLVQCNNKDVVHFPVGFAFDINGVDIKYIPATLNGLSVELPIKNYFNNALAKQEYVNENCILKSEGVGFSELNKEFFRKNKSWYISGYKGNVGEGSSPTFVIPSDFFGELPINSSVVVECTISCDSSMLPKLKKYSSYLCTSELDGKGSNVVLGFANCESKDTEVLLKANYIVTQEIQKYLHVIICANLLENGFIHNIGSVRITANSKTYEVNKFGYFYGSDASYIISEGDYLPDQFVTHGQLRGEIDINKQQWLYGKRWGIMGDSLSDPGYPQSLDVYWRKISQKYNMEIDSQASSGASTSNGHGTATQVEKLSGEFDLITVWIGTNDAIPEGTNAEPFRQRIEALIRRIYERFPTTKIFFITPLANQKTVDPKDEDIATGVYVYCQAIKEVCNRYSIPVLDMYAHSNLNPHMGDLNNVFYADADKCHMNSRGYLERINPLIEKFLLNER